MKKLTAFLPLVLVLIVLIVFALRLTSGVDPKAVQTPQIGRPIPPIALPVLGKKTQQTVLEAQQNQKALVNVFASWCAACRVEHEILLALAATKSWRIIGVAYKDKPENTKAYLKKLGNPYNVVLLDEQGLLGVELGLTGVPETYGIDVTGRIRTHLAGPFADADQLKPLLFESAP